MSTPKRSLAERLEDAVERSDLTPEEADAERRAEHARIAKALRHFASGARTLRPGEDPDAPAPTKPTRGKPL